MTKANVSFSFHFIHITTKQSNMKLLFTHTVLTLLILARGVEGGHFEVRNNNFFIILFSC